MKAFMYHILNRLIIDQYRKHKDTSLDILLEKGFEPSDDDPINAGDALDGSGAVSLIEYLPKVYRRIMHMRYVQNLSIKEVSILTGKTKNAISVQTHRGMAKLKALYSSKLSVSVDDKNK